MTDEEREPRRSTVPPDPDGSEPERRRRLETILRDVIKKGLERGIEAGMGTIRQTNEAVGDLLNAGNLPKEVAGYVFSQIDETKNALVRVVAKEVRDFLEATDLAAELQRALTSLSFEIKTEIRFVPNDAGGVKPEVRSRPVVSARRRTSDPPAGSGGAPAEE